MKKILIVIIMLFVFISGCSLTKTSNSSDGKINIVVTTTMLGDLVSQIGQDKVNVTTLMNSGIDPHSYKPTPSDVLKLNEADVVIYSGLNLEGNLEEILEGLANQGKQILAAGNALDSSDLIKSGNGYDPHIWFDVQNWIKVNNYLSNELALIDEDNSNYFIENSTSYNNELEKLEDYIKSRVNELDPNSRVLITAHDAFSYFGSAYDFEVLGIQGLSTATEAATSDIYNLSNLIVDREIQAIFVENSIPVKSIKALQESVKSKGFNVEIGGELHSDSLGTPNGLEDFDNPGTYIGTVVHNVDTIVDSLN